MRRSDYLDNARYCGNTHKKEVHDLDNEKEDCKIDNIIESGHSIPFETLGQARKLNYDECDFCIGPSKKTLREQKEREYKKTRPE